MSGHQFKPVRLFTNTDHSVVEDEHVCVFAFVGVCVGLHVFPSFVLYELTVLVVLTLSLVIMKV